MNQSLKFALGLFLVSVLRLFPHPPNVEPITATLMPYSKQWGAWSGALFGVASVLIYDLLTGTLGVWSLLTMLGYGLLGLAAGLYFAGGKRSGAFHYLFFAAAGTVFYDALTGLSVGPLVFHQPFMEALVGQIPFTIYHLAGNVALSLVVSPLVERLIVQNAALETSHIAKLVGLTAH
jgi:uncharacterized membrane protein